MIPTDAVQILKSAAIEIDADHTLIVIYYHHRDYIVEPSGKKKTKSSFYKCVARYDSNDNWKTLANNLQLNNPADYASLKGLGISDDLHIKHKVIFTNYRLGKWILFKIDKERRLSLSQFLNGHIIKTKSIRAKRRRKRIKVHTSGAFETDLPFIRVYEKDNVTYDLSTPYNFPLGIWLESIRPKLPRRKPKIIKD